MLLSILPWLSLVDMNCNARLAMLTTGSCLSLLAIMLLMQGVSTDKERLVRLWLYWGAAELMLLVSLYQAKIKSNSKTSVFERKEGTGGCSYVWG